MRTNEVNSLIKALLFYSGIAFMLSCNHKKVQQTEANKTIVWLQLAPNLSHPEPANYILNTNMELTYHSISDIGKDANWETVHAMASNGDVKWIFYPGEAINVKFGFGMFPILNPGDSIFIEYNGEDYRYSGKGAEKLICWNEMRAIDREKMRPTMSNSYIPSFAYYLQWKQFLDNKLSLKMPILESYKDKISSFEFEYLKSLMVSQIESDRIQTFSALKNYSQKDSTMGITLPDLTAIWDSTQNHPLNSWLQSKTDYYADIYCITEFNKMKVWRQFGFDSNSDSLKSDVRNYLYYTRAKFNYKGLLRERVLASIINNQARKHFKDAITAVMLNDYYNQPGFPEYKKQVKELEEKITQQLAKK